LKKAVAFNVSGRPIEIVDKFKCLGRVTANADSDEVVATLQNLEQARKEWASMRAMGPDLRWSRTQNDGGLLQNGSTPHPALWK
jgi:hypothetical protein